MEEKIIQEFKELLARVIRARESFDALLVADGKLDALACDRVGQRGPGLFDR